VKKDRQSDRGQRQIEIKTVTEKRDREEIEIRSKRGKETNGRETNRERYRKKEGQRDTK